MNKYGLPRRIPLPTKRIVRQQCKSGCVFHRSLPYHYDHFDPEYDDARTHDPSGIALLCPDCHQEKSSGRLSNAAVREARDRVLQDDPSDPKWTPILDHSINTFVILGVTFHMCESPGISINGEPVIGFQRAEDGTWMLYGGLCDGAGRSVLRFQDDEITVSTQAWDARLEGKHLSLYAGPRHLVTRFSLDAEKRTVAITHVRMSLANGFVLSGSDDTLVLSRGDRALAKISRAEVRGAAFDDPVVLCGNPTAFDRNIAFNVSDCGTWLDWIDGGAHSVIDSAPAGTRLGDHGWYEWVFERAGYVVSRAWRMLAVLRDDWVSHEFAFGLGINSRILDHMIALNIAIVGLSETDGIRLGANARKFAASFWADRTDESTEIVRGVARLCSRMLSGDTSDLVRRYLQDECSFDTVEDFLGGPAPHATGSEFPRLVSSARRLVGRRDDALALTNRALAVFGRTSRLLGELALCHWEGDRNLAIAAAQEALSAAKAAENRVHELEASRILQAVTDG